MKMTSEMEMRRARMLADQREKAAQREAEIRERAVQILAAASQEIDAANAALREVEHEHDIQVANESAASRALGDACVAENQTKNAGTLAARKNAQSNLRKEENKAVISQARLDAAQATLQDAIDRFAWLEAGAALDLATDECKKDRERQNFELLRAAGLARQAEAMRDYRKHVKLDPRLGESVKPADTWDANWGKPNALVAPRVVSRASDNIEPGTLMTKVAARRTR